MRIVVVMVRGVRRDEGGGMLIIGLERAGQAACQVWRLRGCAWHRLVRGKGGAGWLVWRRRSAVPCVWTPVSVWVRWCSPLHGRTSTDADGFQTHMVCRTCTVLPVNRTADKGVDAVSRWAACALQSRRYTPAPCCSYPYTSAHLHVSVHSLAGDQHDVVEAVPVEVRHQQRLDGRRGQLQLLQRAPVLRHNRCRQGKVR